FNTILKDQLIYSVSDLDVIVCQVISFIRSNSVGVEAKVSLTHSDFSVLDSILELIVPGIDVSIKTASLISEKVVPIDASLCTDDACLPGQSCTVIASEVGSQCTCPFPQTLIEGSCKLDSSLSRFVEQKVLIQLNNQWISDYDNPTSAKYITLITTINLAVRSFDYEQFSISIMKLNSCVQLELRILSDISLSAADNLKIALTVLGGQKVLVTPGLQILQFDLNTLNFELVSPPCDTSKYIKATAIELCAKEENAAQCVLLGATRNPSLSRFLEQKVSIQLNNQWISDYDSPASAKYIILITAINLAVRSFGYEKFSISIMKLNSRVQLQLRILSDISLSAADNLQIALTVLGGQKVLVIPGLQLLQYDFNTLNFELVSPPCDTSKCQSGGDEFSFCSDSVLKCACSKDINATAIEPCAKEENTAQCVLLGATCNKDLSFGFFSCRCQFPMVPSPKRCVSMLEQELLATKEYQLEISGVEWLDSLSTITSIESLLLIEKNYNLGNSIFFNTILKDQLISSVTDLDVSVCQVISFIRSNSVGVEAKVSLTLSDFSVLDSILELIVPRIDVSIMTASLISEKDPSLSRFVEQKLSIQLNNQWISNYDNPTSAKYITLITAINLAVRSFGYEKFSISIMKLNSCVQLELRILSDISLSAADNLQIALTVLGGQKVLVIPGLQLLQYDLNTLNFELVSPPCDTSKCQSGRDEFGFCSDSVLKFACSKG
ncbi:hypothetical protein QYM36_015231, partial [Artemia franciscana]